MLLDLQALKDRMEGDADIVREIFQTFIDDANQRREKFQDALRAGDVERLGRLAHALKGASATLMAQPMREAALSLEKTCRENSGQDVTPLVCGLLELLDKTAAWMRENYANI